MSRPLLSALFASLALVSVAHATEPRPGSVLVFPAVHTDSLRLTCIAVTNTSTTTPVTAMFRYRSSAEAPVSALGPRDCSEVWRAEQLTPADTVSVVTTCHSGGLSDDHGYLVVTAQSPFGGAVAHDALVGHAIFMDMNVGFGGVYSYLPASYQAIPADGQLTDADFDGRIDFDGVEYEQLPDELYLDAFLGVAGSRLALFDLSGEKNATVGVQFYVWNDNERATSTSFSFRCWFEQDLTAISAIFSEAFLAANHPNDPSEVDTDCDGVQDLESGWARIGGTSASTGFSTVPNPPLVGAVLGGVNRFEGGRLLWGSNARSSGQL